MKIYQLLLLALLIVTSSCQKQDNQLTGEWYALNNQAVLTLDLRSDSTFTCQSAASSNMGEFGVYKNADPDSRARWIGYMHQAARAREISSHLWSFRDGFAVRNNETGEWDATIVPIK